ncbi:MAG: hypothetical protein KIT84_12435 [Labilithrix sp.]|nr:hypothetical protein [Labilithrix sp.]MCW5811821.1 hypothetical protein [Labilithrix sp.]
MSLSVRARIAFAAPLLFAAGVAAADATPPPVRLRWEAPPGCPTEDDVLVQIARMLAGRSRPTDRVVTARVKQDGERWRVVLETVADGTRSSRELEASSCAALAEASALIVAVSIDPDVALAPAPTTTAPVTNTDAAPPTPTPTAPPPVPLAPPPLEPPPPTPTPTPIRWALHAGAGAAFGILPAPAVAAHVGASAARGPVGARVDGHWLFPADAGDDATFGALRVRALGCFALLAIGRAHLAPCGGLEADVVWGRGRGVTDPRSATAALFAPVVALDGSYDLTSWLALGVGGDAALPLQRPSFELAGRPVFRVAPVLGGARAEARVRW